MNSITKSYILNIKIIPLMTEYALMIKLVGGTTHSFNPYAYFGHSWSYFDIQNLWSWSWLDTMLHPETLLHRACVKVYILLGPLTTSANDLAGSSADWILLMMSGGKRFQSLPVFGRKLNFSISVLAESLR